MLYKAGGIWKNVYNSAEKGSTWKGAMLKALFYDFDKVDKPHKKGAKERR